MIDQETIDTLRAMGAVQLWLGFEAGGDEGLVNEIILIDAEGNQSQPDRIGNRPAWTWVNAAGLDDPIWDEVTVNDEPFTTGYLKWDLLAEDFSLEFEEHWPSEDEENEEDESWGGK